MNKTPKLRFKEFSGDWNKTTLKQVTNSFEYGMNAAATEFDGENMYIRITDIDENTNKYRDSKVVSPLGVLEEKYLVKENDILFARTGASTGKTYLYDSKDGKLYFAGFLIRANVNSRNNAKFMFLQTKTKQYEKWIKVMSMRSGQPGLNSQEYASYSFNSTFKEEQEKIAYFFSLIDDKVSLQGEKVEALKNYKKGMLQQIFSRELKFKYDDGRDYPEWEEGKVKDIITEHLYQVDKPLNAYWRLGLRSHGKGTFHEYVTDPSKISMDKLYEVKNNMLIVNITFAWEHAIAVTNSDDEGKLVSHRFPTYDFNDNAIYNFYKYYILLPKFKYCLMNASPGGAGRNRVLNKKQFLEIPVPIPCIEEQNKIANILNQLDIKIVKEQEKLDSLNEYKKGLLQQMFV